MTSNDTIEYILASLLFTKYDNEAEEIIKLLNGTITSLDVLQVKEACKRNSPLSLESLKKEDIEKFEKEMTKGIKLVISAYEAKSASKLLGALVFSSLQAKILISQIGLDKQYFNAAVQTVRLINKEINVADWLTNLKQIIEHDRKSKNG